MSDLRVFLEIPYDELEERNLAAKQQRLDRTPMHVLREERMKYLADEKRLKAVTVCFTDLEGRLHMLDYDKKFLLKSADNLTFDGSSIRGFSQQSESDLRLGIDWSAFYWLPADVFGPGKVLVFGEVLERDGTPYIGDMRSLLKRYLQTLYEQYGYTCNAANEIEGFLFKGQNAEQHYYETGRFEFVTTSGYYHSLPTSPLRQFIDLAAEVQRAMGFANEKDHPEVAPSQFEMNYSYSEASIAADQVQLYKLLCRQTAYKLGMTASFLPKPVTGVNGSGMHTNLSVSQNGKNLFYDPQGAESLSPMAYDFIKRILNHALDICLVLNSSVNAYRRLDPHYEAPNEIKFSPIDRGAMIRIPIGNERSARIEVRSIAPDANPYLAFYVLLRTGLEGTAPAQVPEGAILPDNIYDAISCFSSSAYVEQLIGSEIQARFAALKTMQADRCPRRLGSVIKVAEIQYHHEVTNQFLWSMF
ncbi:MAG: glutamine synthetase [Candidatus Thermofonsia Clade 1 bacterium]|jgi:glutamine synthetase|uniref:Glutamine synthetase n=1 Tax=Candidatus Thermofonsia Clade 1 bacterium TaxID=2364210 RepID=A0A2M8PER2_9CHLR|nr:MAG: glutamine synthetase [Candidatus Thermofonsia Clade 1 bacterium]RMF53247.1 MAG: glutamine synthetase [Chloroflexota bacterium]